MRRHIPPTVITISWVAFVFTLTMSLIQLRLLIKLDHSSHPADGGLPVLHKSTNPRRIESRKSPACEPHWNIALSRHPTLPPDDTHKGNGTPRTLMDISWNDTLPISRIYFYHVRKAGGTMIRKYLKKVASNYKIDLTIQETKFAREEVGSRPGTFYVSNVRDPVERSISHFKYEGRWDCQQLVKNKSFVPTKLNAKSFKDWKETKGFVPSSCDRPFSFTGCAVNCYIQTFSGEGCTNDGWNTEHRLARERLFRYNLIFVYERFKDQRYIRAVEKFFGVEGFNSRTSDMWCGWQAHEANKKIPLVVGFEHVLELTRLNEMDVRLYEETASCEGDEYFFPTVNVGRLDAHENWIVEG